MSFQIIPQIEAAPARKAVDFSPGKVLIPFTLVEINLIYKQLACSRSPHQVLLARFNDAFIALRDAKENT